MATVDLTHDDDDEDDRKLPPSEISVFEVVDVDAEPEVEVLSPPSVAAASSTGGDYALALSLSGGQQRSPKRKRGTKLFNCEICLEDDLEGYQGYSIDACKHRFCISCLTGLVQSSVDSASSTASLKITCPQNKCNGTLSLADIQYILRYDPVSWKKYSEKANVCQLEAEVVDNGSDTRRCPSQRCNFIFAFTPGKTGTPFDCPSCQDSFCLNCTANQQKVGPSHKGMTCFERQEQLEKQAEERRKLEEWKIENSKADERFNELMQRERQKGLTKPCPKCKTPITKNGGCSHM